MYVKKLTLTDTGPNTRKKTLADLIKELQFKGIQLLAEMVE